ncbi:MAG: signal peptidase II [Desulfobacterales bacterium]|nr:signal peptidase II [Desulfobacterales bacterium]
MQLDIKQYLSVFNDKEKTLKLLIIGCTVLLMDQVSKIVIYNSLLLYETIPFIPGFFNITHIHNPGGAFGFLSDKSPLIRTWMFMGVAFFAMCLVFYLYYTTPKSHPYLSLGFALIFGGAAGNLIDRVRLGKVIDFLDFYIGKYHWPAFNIADSAISIGMAIFIFHLLLNKMPE